MKNKLNRKQRKQLKKYGYYITLDGYYNYVV